jgi:hypothetical protein
MLEPPPNTVIRPGGMRDFFVARFAHLWPDATTYQALEATPYSSDDTIYLGDKLAPSPRSRAIRCVSEWVNVSYE